VIPEGDKSVALSKVIENVTWQMDQDRKSTALKGSTVTFRSTGLSRGLISSCCCCAALQGHMWASGFASGELIGEYATPCQCHLIIIIIIIIMLNDGSYLYIALFLAACMMMWCPS
jgi:hypothetical protein